MYLMPGKLLVVGQQEQGDSHSSSAWQVQGIWGTQGIKGLRCRIPPGTTLHSKECEDAHEFSVKDNEVKKPFGIPWEVPLTELPAQHFPCAELPTS